MTPQKSFEKVQRLFPGRVKWNHSCLEWMGATPGGYATFYDKKSKRNILVHRYVYERFKGKIEPGMCVCHSCDNPKCVNPDHLWTGSHNDNMLDAIRKGRMPFRKIHKCQRGVLKRTPRAGTYNQRVLLALDGPTRDFLKERALKFSIPLGTFIRMRLMEMVDREKGLAALEKRHG